MRILIVAETVSVAQSGETMVPLYYLERLLERKLDAILLCHSRGRNQLELDQDLSPDLLRRVVFIEDSWLQSQLWRLSQCFHYRIRDLIVSLVIHLLTQLKLRAKAKSLIETLNIDILFQPTPLSPRVPSFMYRMGVPVVIGPMCGGLELPAAFRELDGWFVNWSIQCARAASNVAHHVIRGKLDASALIVANQRTANVLPKNRRGSVHELVESGVDLQRWAPKNYDEPARNDRVIQFVFCGRLVDWKGAQYLVRAFSPLAKRTDVHLSIIGDGELYDDLADQVVGLGISRSVSLLGRLNVENCIDLMRRSDVYVMPSLRECGGLALLEAMALGLPIIASNWLAPSEYLDETCAILVDTATEAAFVDGFTTAMEALASDSELRRRLGKGARDRVHDGYFDWNKKTDMVVSILSEVVNRPEGPWGASSR